MDKKQTTALALTQGSAREMTKANRQRCAQLVALIRRKVDDVRDGFYEIGNALAEINNNALYKAAGHDSLEAFLLHEELFSPSHARRLIVVSELVEREDAIQLGQEKAYALTRYSQAVGNGAPVGDLLKRNVEVNGKPLREATVRDLVSATQQARPAEKDPLAVQRARTAREAQAALRKAGWEGVTVQCRRGGRSPAFTVLVDEEVLLKVARLR